MSKEAITNDEAAMSLSFAQKYKHFVDEHGWSGSTLKLIAVVTMFIDHTGAGILENYLKQNPDIPNFQQIYTIDLIMRGIGRMAFPIFCFLLVEGFLKTSDVKKYIVRMLMFALISEVPFDLCIFRTAFYPNYQNVYFSLAFGLMTLAVCEKINELTLLRFNLVWANIIKVVLNLLVLFAFSVLALVLKTDYYFMGIVTIYLIYTLRKTGIGILLAEAFSCVVVLNEIPALVCLIPIALYNGRRGLKLKYFFYAFYPAHLLIIWGISRLLGVA